MDFVPPAPGTYKLQRHHAGAGRNGPDLEGRARKLSRYTRERITLLGFVYTSCTDPQGCPMAYRVFDRLQDEIRATPALKDKVQLVTLSFDPARDTPSVMQRYAGSSSRTRRARWFFLTTPSERELAPCRKASGRTCARCDRRRADAARADPRAEGLPDRPRGVVREIYTSTYLYPRAVVGDIKTLLMEGGAGAAAPAARVPISR